MKIAFLCPSLSRTAGGIFEIERRLAQSLALIPGAYLEVFGSADEHTVADRPAWHPLEPKSFAFKGPNSFRYSSALRDAFLSTTADMAHIHALWMYNSILVHRWGRKTGHPYVVTPNGMLEPWALRNSGWKKKLAGPLYERRMLSNAACIQANTEKEAADIRAFGLKNPIAIIPNGIDVPEVSSQKSVVSGQISKNQTKSQVSGSSVSDFARGRKVLLYLGRIHPKKGLVNLLKAWAEVNRKSEIGNRKFGKWVLAIAGWNQGGHEAQLKQLATGLGLKWMDVREKAETLKTEKLKGMGFNVSMSACQHVSVLFLGPQFGEEKAACYRDCDAFILPSFSEGLPMVVLEAWAYGKPVLMTPECNLPEGFAANAAIRIETDVESIAQSLNELFRIPHSAVTFPLRLDRGEGQGEVSNLAPCSELSAMGMRGRALVARRFVWPKIAADMKSVYEWVLGGGPKPGCVV